MNFMYSYGSFVHFLAKPIWDEINQSHPTTTPMRVEDWQKLFSCADLDIGIQFVQNICWRKLIHLLQGGVMGWQM